MRAFADGWDCVEKRMRFVWSGFSNFNVSYNKMEITFQMYLI
jgi:hypothetical protein